ncbi:MAG: 50S ribosomal protein L24 [Verrucomicrobiota bacterium]|nr:50S ribosomal protein L24 [Verrucomicrobiota bacterium]
MSIQRIKKNDIVIAVRGVMRGKSGKVLEVLKSKDRAIVEGLNLIKKAMRKTKDNPQGGIVKKEGSLPLSGLLLFCPQCKKGVKISRERDGDRRARRCRKCEHSFDG